MDINNLPSYELTYELLIRGENVDGCRVAQKRTMLRNALQHERSGAASIEWVINFHPGTEIALCTQKLDELLSCIQLFKVAIKDNEYGRIKPRLAHVEKRISRMDRIHQAPAGERECLDGIVQRLGRTLEWPIVMRDWIKS